MEARERRRTGRRLVVAAVLLISGLSVALTGAEPGGAATATSTLVSRQDAETSPTTPNANDGQSTSMTSETGGPRAFVRFGPQDVLKAVDQGTLDQARLRVFVTAASTASRTLYVHRVDTFWSESAITYNCPQDTNLGNTVANCSTTWSGGWPIGYSASGSVPAGTSGWVTIDVTGLIDDYLDGTQPNFGFLLRSSASTTYATRESANAPQLVLDYTVEGPTTVLRVAGDGWSLRRGASGPKFVPQGTNYVRPRAADPPCGLLLEDLWADNWSMLEGDFEQAVSLGFNALRIFLQVPAFMSGPGTVKEESLIRLDQVVRMARRVGIKLDITGLNNFDRSRVPTWFASADDDEQLQMEEYFWTRVAQRYPGEPSIMAYDLQNEVAINPTTEVVSQPLNPDCPQSSFVHFHGRTPQARWTAFVHDKYGTEANLASAWSDYPRSGESWSLIKYGYSGAPAARTRDWFDFRRSEARRWTSAVSQAVRAADPTHLVTLGDAYLPFEDRGGAAACSPFPGAGSSFTPLDLKDHLDFLTLHQYPDTYSPAAGCTTSPPSGADSVDRLVAEQRASGRFGMPVMLEEVDPYRIGPNGDFNRFLDRSLESVSGWFGQWDGRSPAELEAAGDPIRAANLQRMLDFFQQDVPDTGVTRTPAAATTTVSLRGLVVNQSQRFSFMDAFSSALANGDYLDPVLNP